MGQKKKLKIGIYYIFCRKNKKFYIGSSNNFTKRFNNHKVKLRQNIHFNVYLQSAFNKYGESEFNFGILENCPLNRLIEKEQFYIDLFDVCKQGFNILPRADRTVISEKTRKKLSQSAKNNKRALGYKHTEEARNRISITHLGNKSRLGKHSLKHSKTISEEGNPRYIDGRSLKRNKCIDCGKLLAKHSFYHKTKRCSRCAKINE